MVSQNLVCKGFLSEQVAFWLHVYHPGYAGSCSKIPARMHTVCTQQDLGTLEMICPILDITMLSMTMYQATQPSHSWQTAVDIHMHIQKKAYITHSLQCTNFEMEKKNLKIMPRNV